MKLNIVDTILEALADGLNLLPRPFETPHQHSVRLRRWSYREYYQAMQGLKRRGVVKFVRKDGQQFIQLTEKGVLEVLLQKAGVVKHRHWDRKWRVCIFDIPEDAHLQRDRLRLLLKRYGFYKLQASVFINPYPLNREAVRYLEETGLNKYIRFLKVEEMDNDQDLKKHFGL